MAGFIEEFFGYRAKDVSGIATDAAKKKWCPFVHDYCEKTLSNRERSGVCAIRQKTASSPTVICCPNRLYASEYMILKTITQDAFGKTFSLYADFQPACQTTDGESVPLAVTQKHSTSVYKVQEAFSSIDLPDRNVYEAAIRKSLYE